MLCFNLSYTAPMRAAHFDDDDEEKSQVEDEDEVREEDNGKGVPSSLQPKRPSTSRPVMGSIYEIERARLQVDQDRLHLEREHLEVVRNIHSSLVDINTNMQMLFAVVCNINGVTLVDDEN